MKPSFPLTKAKTKTGRAWQGVCNGSQKRSGFNQRIMRQYTPFKAYLRLLLSKWGAVLVELLNDPLHTGSIKQPAM